MGLMRKLISTREQLQLKSKNKTSGQAVVEYVLMVTVAVSLVSVIGIGFRQNVVKIWIYYIGQISAACPGCKTKYK
jgi:hypothetical protein